MCIYIEGIKLPDEKWKKMKKVLDTCRENDVSVPKEVLDFFDNKEPCPDGVQVDILHRKFKEEMIDGIEVKVEDIPKDVKVLKFRVSWD
jgi:hypothetical protein